jgi:hypothetical protein
MPPAFTQKVKLCQLLAFQSLPAWELQDPANRELHLSDAEFEHVLGLPPAEFYMLPAWKQAQLKRAAALF